MIDFILHCMWIAVKGFLGTGFIIIGMFLLSVGIYWFNRGRDYLEGQIDPMYDVNFTDEEEDDESLHPKDHR